MLIPATFFPKFSEFSEFSEILYIIRYYIIHIAMNFEKEMNDACTCRSKCKIEAVISVDERGQILLPKDIRKRAGIDTGDKLTLVSWEKEGRICCMTIMKAEELSKAVEDVIGPIIGQEE
jgi:AbrB family looped-hinge helix DNA binding protein